jgi:ribonuclease J
MNKKKNFQILALGGLNEVGKNCYILETHDEIIIVDSGIKFLNSNNYGLANAIIPGFSYIQENKNKVRGIFITHGHEDHIGAIPYLLEIIPDVPVYGSDFSLAILKQKMRNRREMTAIPFNDETVIKTSDFEVHFFRVTHSIPGSFGIIARVIENGLTIAMTGDFKFD